MRRGGNTSQALAAQRAERCFALARSTQFKAERDNAIRHGIAIAETAGLPLNDFEIPGRVRGNPSRPNDLLIDPIDRLARALERAREMVGAAPEETPYDAQRRNFNEAIVAAAARDALRKTQGPRRPWPRAETALTGSITHQQVELARLDYEASKSRMAILEQRWPKPDDAVSYLFENGCAVYRDTDGEQPWYVPHLHEWLSDADLYRLADGHGAA